MTPTHTRRAALLGLALFAVACDVAQFALDPKPRFEQTWNLAGPDTRMSVANLLPSGGVVTIKPDSSAFSLTIDSTTFSAQLAPNCAACVALNGTNAIKPAFTMAPGNSTALPTDIVKAAILAGQIQVKMVNNLTFDPLYVNTGGGSPPQGFLKIVVRSGSVVLGRDSIRGAVNALGSQVGCASLPNPCNISFSPGTTIIRNITLTTGTVENNLTVDVTVDSPVGDHLVPIDVSKSFTASATVPSIDVASVEMNVPSRTFDSGGADSISLPASGDFVVGLGLNMTISNPFNTVGGGLSMIFAWGPGPSNQITKPVTLPSGCPTAPCVGTAVVSLDSAEVQQLLNGGENVSIKLTGNVSSGGTVTVTPKQEVTISNRMVLKIRLPGTEK